MTAIPADQIEFVRGQSPRDYCQVVFRVSRYPEPPESDEEMRDRLVAKVAEWFLERAFK